ncbi:hypothetical protein DL93DRAFT_1462919 [Clavulina sp. PMI_390]|nr:hypothetical protein DL93DRAFT_1462919 [Clavulina sp. PMI_390]
MGPNSDGIPVYRGKLRRNGVRVIIKEYRNTPRQQFLKDLDRLYPVVHPNLPMVIAKSVDKEPIPYVLLEYAASGSARLYLKKQIAGDPLASIIACIRLISDVMSALQYIVNSNRFEAYDIENCTDVSRYSITGDRKVLIGQDLVTRNPLKTSIIPENQSLATWLKAKAWFIVMDLLYGGANVIDWTNWDTIRTTAPHLRPILTMVTFKCPSFDTMVSRFRSVVHEINLREDELTYKDIRQAIVSLPSLVPTYMYKPPVPLDVVVGDIGYMHGGQFIRLGSIRPSIRKISPLPEYILTTPDVTSREESEGVIRREIRAAHYAEIARWGESEYVEDVQTYWEFFVAATRSLFSELGPEHDGVRVSDLILGDDLFV